MHEIKSVSGAVLYRGDSAESLREAVIAATREGAYLRGAYLRGVDLSGADLSGANLRGAYLSGAYLCGVDLSGADLSGADLSGADLSGVNLRGAYLSGAYLSGANLRDAVLRDGVRLIGARPVVQVGPIGSRSDWLVAYLTDGGIRIDAGCQRQITREAFEARVSDTHGDNQHAREYRAALAYIDAHAAIWSDAACPPAHNRRRVTAGMERAMQDQHKLITGYRDLTAEEIGLMNEAKALAETVGALVKKIEGKAGSSTALAAALKSEEIETDLLDAMLSAAADGYESRRWLEIGKCHLQQGFMALTRSIAKPTTF